MAGRKLAGFYKNKRILIPGGAGFIGSNLARSLVECGASVTIVDSFSKYCGANNFNLREIKHKVTLISGKIESFILKKGINRYDIIFNCAGLSDHHIGLRFPELDYAINCFSGLKILQALADKRSICKSVFLGSRSQYGKTDFKKAIPENYPLRPLDIQAAHKTLLENYCKVYADYYQVDLTFLRLTNVYGYGQRLKGAGIGALGEIIKSGITGKEIIIFGAPNRVKDLLFIDDVISALLLVGMKKEKGFQVYNLGGQLCKISALIDSLKAKIKNPKIAAMPFPRKIKLMDTGSAVLDAGKIKESTGWAPQVNIKEGMDKTFDYYDRYKKYYLKA